MPITYYSTKNGSRFSTTNEAQHLRWLDSGHTNLTEDEFDLPLKQILFQLKQNADAKNKQTDADVEAAAKAFVDAGVPQEAVDVLFGLDQRVQN